MAQRIPDFYFLLDRRIGQQRAAVIVANQGNKMVENFISRLMGQELGNWFQGPPFELLNESGQIANLKASREINALFPGGGAFSSGIGMVNHQFPLPLDPGPNAVGPISYTGQRGGKNAPVGSIP